MRTRPYNAYLLVGELIWKRFEALSAKLRTKPTEKPRKLQEYTDVIVICPHPKEEPKHKETPSHDQPRTAERD